jgi:hypothetical protein
MEAPAKNLEAYHACVTNLDIKFRFRLDHKSDKCVRLYSMIA